MAKQITMSKDAMIIRCSEDHIEHFKNLGYKEQNNTSKKSEKMLKPKEEEKE